MLFICADEQFEFIITFCTVVELACGEYGVDKIKIMVNSMANGDCSEWFQDPSKILKLETLRQLNPLQKITKETESLEATSPIQQLKILMQRGWVKTKRDATLTHLR